MKFWDDGQPNSSRIRNVKFTWDKLKHLNIFLKENNIICDAFLYDFSPEKIISDSRHTPYELGVYKKSEKTNLILEQQKNFDFFMMFDCDAFFDKHDYEDLLGIIRNLENGDIVTFDLAKLEDNTHDYIVNNEFLKEKANWSYAYSGNRDNGPLYHHTGSLGGVYICYTKTLLELGGFDEKYIGWGGEDGDMLNRICTSNLYYNIKPIKNFSPYHLPHFSDWGNIKYNKRFNE